MKVLPPCRRLVWVATVLWLGLALGGAASAVPASRARMQGRALVEVLAELRESGLDVVFSTAVVGEDLRILHEPSARGGRALLEEILPPLGLRLREAPGGALQILPGPALDLRLAGRVVEAETGAPVAGARVHLPGLGREAAADEMGRFVLEDVPPGSFRMVVQARDYRTVSRRVSRRRSDRDEDIRVVLEPIPRLVTEVFVTPGRHPLLREEEAPRWIVSREEARLTPSSGGDVSRVVALLPGVTAPDNSAALHVRGGTARDVSLVLDGFEIYDPYHLASFQSPFSLVDSNIVDRIDFFGGGFTAERGDRHGAFVDITTLRGPEEGRGELEVGTVNSRFTHTGPWAQGQGSWLISARGWYPEALIDTTELGGHENLDPRFADLYGKIAFPSAQRHRLSAHALLSYDRLSFSETDEGDFERADATTRNGYAWLRVFSDWRQGWQSESRVSVGRIERQRDGVAAEAETLVIDDGRVVEILGVEHDSVLDLSETQALKMGLGLRRLLAEYRYSQEVPSDPARSRVHRLDPDGTSVAAYLSHRVRIGPDLVTELGLRWDRQSHTDDNQLSPRFNATWRPAQDWELRFSLGRYQQSQRIHELQVEDGETQFHTAETSEQVELSVERAFASGMRLKVNAYYQDLSDLRPRYENLFEPIELFPEATEDRIMVAPEAARLRGLEVMARSPRDRRWFWWASYAFSAAEDRVDGTTVSRSWDQTHAAKVLVGYRRPQRWSVSLAGSIHTGWPTTPVSGEAVTLPSGETEFELVPGERNSRRYPTYARLDLKLRRAFRPRVGTLWWGLDVLNLLDRDNPCCLDDVAFRIGPDGGVVSNRRDGNWLGTSASMSLRWEF